MFCSLSQSQHYIVQEDLPKQQIVDRLLNCTKSNIYMKTYEHLFFFRNKNKLTDFIVLSAVQLLTTIQLSTKEIGFFLNNSVSEYYDYYNLSIQPWSIFVLQACELYLSEILSCEQFKKKSPSNESNDFGQFLPVFIHDKAFISK